MIELYVGLHCGDACRKSGIFELYQLEKVLRGLRRAPWKPENILLRYFLVVEMFLPHLLARLSNPFPRKIGITEVEAVLNEITRPFAENGWVGGGRWFW